MATIIDVAKLARVSKTSVSRYLNEQDRGHMSDETKERLEILNRSNDGFFIAGEDLRLRGPGDLFGIRQSGILDFKIADVFQDAEVLKIAGEEANKILKRDPELKDPSYKKIKNHKIQQIMLETTL